MERTLEMLVVKRDREIGYYLEGFLFPGVVIDFSLGWDMVKHGFMIMVMTQ